MMSFLRVERGRSFAAANDAYLSDDEAIAKIGHPELWVRGSRGVPQRLKPSCGASIYGTAEAVPLIRRVLPGVLASLLLMGTVGTAGAQSSVSALKKRLIPANTNVATTSLTSYLERVKADNQNIQPTVGAIWTDTGRLTRLNSDVRAMRPHDLIAVVVQESLAASTDGTVKNSRASSASASLTGLIGAVKTNSALSNLLTQAGASALNAAGASATNSSLTTTFGGQVIDVLPNGMLVIEAARQVEFSQQTQTIVLRGLVRPEDISQQNEVLSTAISSLELEVKGKGIVNDYTRRQNPVVRFFQSILVF